MKKPTNEFDLKAAEWDNNPMHWDRSEAIAKAIMKLIPLNTGMTALEFGAGTGILSFMLKDHLGSITLMDNSSEMVKIMMSKIETTKSKNLTALNFDLENRDYTDGRFDLIFTQMALHHVTDTERIIDRFYNLLNPGGHLAIADLYPEDGSFHGENVNVHRGFDVGILSEKLRKQGFEVITHEKCFTINKNISDTETKQFDVFLLIARRHF